MNHLISLIVVLSGLVFTVAAAAAPVEHEEDFQAWLTQAEAGDPKAMRIVGTSYYSGWGTEPDYSQAVKWYLRATLAGDAAATRHLGVMFYNGHGVTADRDFARLLYETAVSRGYTEAQRDIELLDAGGETAPAAAPQDDPDYDGQMDDIIELLRQSPAQ